MKPSRKSGTGHSTSSFGKPQHGAAVPHPRVFPRAMLPHLEGPGADSLRDCASDRRRRAAVPPPARLSAPSPSREAAASPRSKHRVLPFVLPVQEPLLLDLPIRRRRCFASPSIRCPPSPDCTLLYNGASTSTISTASTIVVQPLLPSRHMRVRLFLLSFCLSLYSLVIPSIAAFVEPGDFKAIISKILSSSISSSDIVAA